MSLRSNRPSSFASPRAKWAARRPRAVGPASQPRPDRLGSLSMSRSGTRRRAPCPWPASPPTAGGRASAGRSRQGPSAAAGVIVWKRSKSKAPGSRNRGSTSSRVPAVEMFASGRTPPWTMAVQDRRLPGGQDREARGELRRERQRWSFSRPSRSAYTPPPSSPRLPENSQLRIVGEPPRGAGRRRTSRTSFPRRCSPRLTGDAAVLARIPPPLIGAELPRDLAADDDGAETLRTRSLRPNRWWQRGSP